MENETSRPDESRPLTKHNVNGSADVSDEWMNGELCEREPCDYCDMDGSWKNGFHLLGCPNGLLS